MTYFFDFIIRFYQKTLSPDYGLLSFYFPYGYCRFYPSCSMYARESLRKYGFFRGILMFLKRFVRCNPWSQPSIDPVDRVIF